MNDVLHDLDVWEGGRDEYYRCGGETLSGMTEIMTAHKILAAATPSSYRLRLNECRSFAAFKKELRDTMRYLEDSGTRTTGAAAHMLEEPQTYAQPQYVEEQPAGSGLEERQRSPSARRRRHQLRAYGRSIHRRLDRDTAPTRAVQSRAATGAGVFQSKRSLGNSHSQ